MLSDLSHPQGTTFQASRQISGASSPSRLKILIEYLLYIPDTGDRVANTTGKSFAPIRQGRICLLFFMSSYGCTNEQIDTRSDLEEKSQFNTCAQDIVNGA